MARIIVPEILAPNGKPARRGGMTLQELVDRTGKAHPDWPKAAVIWQAEKLFDRLPHLERAIDAGLKEPVGRELRLRWEAGLGVEVEARDSMGKDQLEFVEAMTALEPTERGVVLDILRQKVCA